MTDSPASDLETTDGISDDELCALALAADPDATVGDDAVSLWDLDDSGIPQPLPAWYMPAPMPGPRRLSGWRGKVVRVNVGLIIAAFLAINACGLCNTYGQLHP
jgi:hypothetical protein